MMVFSLIRSSLVGRNPFSTGILIAVCSALFFYGNRIYFGEFQLFSKPWMIYAAIGLLVVVTFFVFWLRRRAQRKRNAHVYDRLNPSKASKTNGNLERLSDHLDDELEKLEARLIRILAEVEQRELPVYLVFPMRVVAGDQSSPLEPAKIETVFNFVTPTRKPVGGGELIASGAMLEKQHSVTSADRSDVQLLSSSCCKDAIFLTFGHEFVAGCDSWRTDAVELLLGRIKAFSSKRLNGIRCISPDISGIILLGEFQDFLDHNAESMRASSSEISACLGEISRKCSYRIPSYAYISGLENLSGYSTYRNATEFSKGPICLGTVFPTQMSGLPGFVKYFSKKRSISSLTHEVKSSLHSLVQQTSQTCRDLIARSPDEFGNKSLFAFPQQLGFLAERAGAYAIECCRSQWNSGDGDRGKASFFRRLFRSRQYNGQAILRAIFFVPSDSRHVAREIGAETLPNILNENTKRWRNSLIRERNENAERVEILQNTLIPERNLSEYLDLKHIRRSQRLKVLAIAFVAVLAIGSGFLAIVADDTSSSMDRVKLEMNAIGKDAPRNLSRYQNELAGYLDLAVDLISKNQTEEARSSVQRISSYVYSTVPESQLRADAYDVVLSKLLGPAVALQLADDIDRFAGDHDATVSRVLLTLEAHNRLGTEDLDAQQNAFGEWFLQAANEGEATRIVTSFSENQKAVIADLLKLHTASRNNWLRAKVDPVMLRRAQQKLLEISPAEHILSVMHKRTLALRMPELDVTAPFEDFNLSRSGASLVEPLYTRAGFYEVFLNELPKQLDRSNALTSLGDEVASETVHARQRIVMDEITRRYTAAYIQTWAEALDSIKPEGPMNLREVRRKIEIVTSAESPLTALAERAVRETLLPVPQDVSEELKPGSSSTQDRFAVDSHLRIQALQDLAQLEKISADSDWPGHGVELYFRKLHELILTEDGNNGLLEVHKTFFRLGDEVDKVLLSQDPSKVAFNLVSEERIADSEATFGRLLRESEGMPAPFRSVSEELVRQAWANILDLSVGYINRQYQAAVYGACETAIIGRFPLDHGAAEDVTIDDFNDFFAPAGRLALFDAAMRDALTPRDQIVGDGLPGLLAGDEYETMIETAAEIRRAFMPGQDSQMSVGFTLIPLFLDENASRISVSHGDNEFLYRHETPRRHPAALSDLNVAITFTERSRRKASFGVKGPWSWLKIFDSFEFEPDGIAGIYEWSVNIGGNDAKFKVLADSATNPLLQNSRGHEFVCAGQVTERAGRTF